MKHIIFAVLLIPAITMAEIRVNFKYCFNNKEGIECRYVFRSLAAKLVKESPNSCYTKNLNALAKMKREGTFRFLGRNFKKRNPTLKTPELVIHFTSNRPDTSNFDFSSSMMIKTSSKELRKRYSELFNYSRFNQKASSKDDCEIVNAQDIQDSLAGIEKSHKKDSKVNLKDVLKFVQNSSSKMNDKHDIKRVVDKERAKRKPMFYERAAELGVGHKGSRAQ